MRAWREEFAGTWLGNPDSVSFFDTWVRERLVAHRGGNTTSLESVAPWSVNMLAKEIERFGRESRWLWCTAAITLMAELVFGADAGGIFPARDTRYRYDLDICVNALRVVRNATFHPAFQSSTSGSGKPPIEQLYALLDNDDDSHVREVAVRLVTDWSYFAERPIATYALRNLNSSGRLYEKQLREAQESQERGDRP